MPHSCQHQFAGDHAPCTMPASPDSTLCIWHDASLNKSDAYVATLLAHVIENISNDLCEYFLPELDWPHAKLSNMRLDGIDLRDAHLPYAELANSNLRNANLRRCNLRKADLQGCDLSGCDLKHTDFFGANLSGANLSHAQLNQTNLLNANLSNVNFEGVYVDSFQWNDRTDFTDAHGLDARPRSATADDETQTFLTPVALAHYKNEQRKKGSSLLNDANTVLHTHTYSNNASSSSLRREDVISSADSQKALDLKEAYRQQHDSSDSALDSSPADLDAITQATHIQTSTPKSAAPIPMQPPQATQRALLWVSAASILFAVGATAFATWASFRIAKEPAAPTVREVITYVNTGAVPLSENPEHRRLLKQLQTFVSDDKSRQDTLSHNELLLSQIAQEKQDLELQVERLSIHNDNLINREVAHHSLQRKYQKLLRHSSRLNDTASILAQGVERLGAENTALNDMKNTRLTMRSQLELLQTKSLQLQQENETLKTENTDVKDYNQSILAELSTSRTTLERFLSRIEGSRLHAFLTKDASQLAAIPVKAHSPIVLNGDHLITLELHPAGTQGYIVSKLFVQRSDQSALPDVNVIYYNADMKPIRSISYGFPGSEQDTESFALSKSQFNSSIFPSYVRILVNPGASTELIASNRMSPTDGF